MMPVVEVLVCNFEVDDLSTAILKIELNALRRKFY